MQNPFITIPGTAWRSVAFAGVLVIGAAGAAAAATVPARSPSTRVDAAASVEMQEVLSEYVHATDHRDGATLAALFTEHGSVNILAPDGSGGYSAVTTPIVGRPAIANAVAHAQAPLPALGAEHHVITAPISTASESGGHLSMQFTTYAIQGAAEPAGGWPAGTAGAPGTITAYESGYYAATFVKGHGVWSISRLDIQSDLPVVIPAP
ncbi:nuclear transport factor 2 family protein [Lacisediminihabitans sp.]|uniref:nuclear transport factor 2 family protein n=1 Tax=Lacisediminihabitans sp. TaxID=2787631 RepID=UPI00374CA365